MAIFNSYFDIARGYPQSPASSTLPLYFMQSNLALKRSQSSWSRTSLELKGSGLNFLGNIYPTKMGTTAVSWGLNRNVNGIESVSNLIGGFNSSEQIWVRQLGWWNSQYMENHKIHVPNHQPVIGMWMGLKANMCCWTNPAVKIHMPAGPIV